MISSNNNAHFGFDFQPRAVNRPFTGTFQLLQANKSVDKTGIDYAEKRATHNAVERQRRESLNSKFQELAHALPSLQTVRRPSKSIIVQKCLDFVNTTVKKTERYEKEIRHLRQQNKALMAEMEELRIHAGNSAPPSPALVMGVNNETLEIMHGTDMSSHRCGRLSRQTSNSSLPSLESPTISHINNTEELSWQVRCTSESESTDDNSSSGDDYEFNMTSLESYSEYLSNGFMPSFFENPSLIKVSDPASLGHPFKYYPVA
ncbi:hypothetical protein BC938DRAFT_482533 [Jimgerdemannia flammicorona]|uniref:BHLH domain-containing protein n=1 Tax=Jimgerdemannia flammicorona TaxID=994334 RepID=A0A433QDY9_9FUNG|nr:hypothetical protein BC938DRAFT_482533 [Jimgerdemannia flammicorona]